MLVGEGVYISLCLLVCGCVSVCMWVFVSVDGKWSHIDHIHSLVQRSHVIESSHSFTLSRHPLKTCLPLFTPWDRMTCDEWMNDMWWVNEYMPLWLRCFLSLCVWWVNDMCTVDECMNEMIQWHAISGWHVDEWMAWDQWMAYDEWMNDVWSVDAMIIGWANDMRSVDDLWWVNEWYATSVWVHATVASLFPQ